MGVFWSKSESVQQQFRKECTKIDEKTSIQHLDTLFSEANTLSHDPKTTTISFLRGEEVLVSVCEIPNKFEVVEWIVEKLEDEPFWYLPHWECALRACAQTDDVHVVDFIFDVLQKHELHHAVFTDEFLLQLFELAFQHAAPRLAHWVQSICHIADTFVFSSSIHSPIHYMIGKMHGEKQRRMVSFIERYYTRPNQDEDIEMLFHAMQHMSPLLADWITSKCTFVKEIIVERYFKQKDNFSTEMCDWFEGKFMFM